jgi:LacI family transcriptional regulator
MSIVDVAKEAGVSKSTVSRVINQVPGVTDTVRQSVLDAMHRLGYQPSVRRPGPKPISRKGIRSGNVMMLMMGYEPHEIYRLPVFPSLLHGVEIALRETGLNLVLAGYHPNEPLPAGLASEQVDGVLLMGQVTSVSQAIRSKLENIPAVGLMRGYDDLVNVCDRVVYNNASVGPMAADYLWAKGHTQVAFLNFDPAHTAFSRRQTDFVQSMTDRGGHVTILQTAEKHIESANPLNNLRPLIAQLKAMPENQRPAALCCASDSVLPDLYMVMMEQGIKPMVDIDIVSCDNEKQILARLAPRPATIDIRTEMIGRQAVRQLRWRFANQDEPSRITIMIEPVLVKPD